MLAVKQSSFLSSFPSSAMSIEDALLVEKAISRDQLAVARLEQQRHGGTLIECLVSLGFVSEMLLARIQSACSGWPLFEGEEREVTEASIPNLPHALIQETRLLPYRQEEGMLTIITADVYDLSAVTALQRYVGGEIALRFLIAPFSFVERVLQRLLHQAPPIEEWLRALEKQPLVQGDKVVNLVNAFIHEALRQRASDIHFEPEEVCVVVRYRIDGVLTVAYTFHKSIWPSICVRLKVLANLDIAEARLPQDGRFSLQVDKRVVDCRLATHPLEVGENIVMRLLRQDQEGLTLQAIGLSPEWQNSFRHIAHTPEGMVLVTGPTGSGKTTTLYALLAEVNQPGVNIMTLEDPVEYRLPLIRQTQVREGFGFADGIRSLLRQDPDIMLVGEVRDQETALMATQAAMTGHKVYATLHTTDALGAFYRLMDLGLKRVMLVSVLKTVIAQRLVRQLCPHCKTPVEPTREERAFFEPLAVSPLLSKVRGCAHCHNTGYYGRLPVIEVLHVTPHMADCLIDGVPRAHMWEALKEQGFRSMWQDGLSHVVSGKVSFEELQKVVPRGRECWETSG